jgi:hypothetical protein
MARSWLLDPQAADRPGDDELLDLFGALEDVVRLPMGVSDRCNRSLTSWFGLLEFTRRRPSDQNKRKPRRGRAPACRA